MASTVIDVLRRSLPAFLRGRPPLGEAARRAIWAITHCRTRTMGGHLHVCRDCGKRVFDYHSCNHRSCPLCGRSATAAWVGRELAKRIAAPYFMVTFTLPAELRGLFFGPDAKGAYDLFFAASSTARNTLDSSWTIFRMEVFTLGQWSGQPTPHSNPHPADHFSGERQVHPPRWKRRMNSLSFNRLEQ